MPETVNTKISKANFAKLAGVGRASVTLSVKRKKLIEDSNGFIDLNDPTNAAYLAERRNNKKDIPEKIDEAESPKSTKTKQVRESKRKNTIKSKPSSSQVIPVTGANHSGSKRKELEPDDLDDDIPIDEVDEMSVDNINQSFDITLLTIQKLRAEIIYKREAAEAFRVKRLTALGILVEAEYVRQLLGKFNSELKIRLLEYPKKEASRIIALIHSGKGEHEIITLLENANAKAIDFAKALIANSKVGA